MILFKSNEKIPQLKLPQVMESQLYPSKQSQLSNERSDSKVKFWNDPSKYVLETAIVTDSKKRSQSVEKIPSIINS